VHYHGFAGLSTIPGQCEESSEFTCLGHQWTLRIYPGGTSNSDDEMVSLFLKKVSNKGIKIDLGFSVKDSNGKDRRHHAYILENNVARSIVSMNGQWNFVVARSSYGKVDFARRSIILDHLVEGSLVIEVQMKLAEPAETIPSPFIPENPACNAIQKMFMDEKSSDVVFEVQHLDSGESNPEKKAKISPTAFYAHRLILQTCAPQLAEMCGGPMENGSSPPVPISIPNVTPKIFHHILNYVYGGEMASEELEANARDIIDAADKYGVSNLKLEAEACLVNTTTINVENVMDLLLYSDSKSCALLKEAVMDFLLKNVVDVMDKVSFKDVPGEMIKDFMAAVARNRTSKGVDEASSDGQIGTMRITELRRKAHEKGLEVDGSREMLIAALKESS